MMKAICKFFDNAKRVINESLKAEKKITWALIAKSCDAEYFALTNLKFEDPLQPPEQLAAKIDKLCDDIDMQFRKLVLS